MIIPSDLRTLVHGLDAVDVPDEVHAVCEELLKRSSQRIQAILFYGSCLRSGYNDEGILDLYLIVDHYRPFFHRPLLALANQVLPPNVFYIEVAFRDRIVRAKYAILSLQQFQRSTSTQWFHSYFWARFAQPTKVLYTANPDIAAHVYDALARSIMTFFTRVVPQLPERFNAFDLWEQGLSLTYQCELRTERSGRVAHILEADREYYQQTAHVALGHLPFPIATAKTAQPALYQTELPPFQRMMNSSSWALRRYQGKLLSILRLIKGLFTFQGGVDYILWKIERHSGVSIELTPRQRQHPLLSSPGVFWKLYRKGAFR
ncbi:MAG: hypothetical protein MRJ96_00025 [Nitrospirales bacterium]|nr:hypothetical protein [Nitrospira sp.]MDR4499827.1 hypothetical protein [Nitrospirales bacterium]